MTQQQPATALGKGRAMDSAVAKLLDSDTLVTFRDGAREAFLPGIPSPDNVRALRESGLLGLVVPQEFGGTGADAGQANSVVEEVAAADPSVAIMLYLHCCVVERIKEYGSAAQRAHWLPRVVDHRWLAASAWSEPGSTADKKKLATTAEPRGDASWRINGGKSFATSVTVADFLLVLVQLPPSDAGVGESGYGGKDQALVLVPAGTPGVDVAPEAHDLAGMRGSGTGTLRLDDVVVGQDAVLCAGEHTPRAIGLPHRLGLTLAAVSVGAARSAYELAVAAAEHRGLLAAADTRRRLAEMSVTVEAARSMVTVLPTYGPQETAHLAYAAKVFASRASQRVCRQVRGLLGSSGYMRGHDIHRISLDAEAVAHMGPPNHLCVDLLAARLEH
ncbi:acyl-CoA dehydrogenase family protein [Streptomyces sp. NRRL B-1347]|uniref:acyl-CoA dehydrogenase family protein n=1 Tax=Streptomyces sp. NRRL B-1347 TaxID=1476877 RepID=UPI001F3606FB|nr:acyl-CoA dehydrogenase family protein [Streptomyces sp. NRRL B-1347]